MGSTLPDDQTVSRCLVDFLRNDGEIIHLQHALDLSEEAGQQPKVAAGHSDQAGNNIRCQHFIGKRDADRYPAACNAGSMYSALVSASFIFSSR